MPELPDIAGFCRLFAEHAAGGRVTGVVVRNATVVRAQSPDRFVGALQGQRFEEPRRHGKWLWAGTGGPTLVLHFGMTGRLRWEPRESQAQRFDRVDMFLAGGKLVFQDQRNLGGLWLADGPDELRQITGDLGPDALKITARDIEERFAGSRRLKALLMDQSVLAGLGNMLSDEVLWRAQLHPARRFDELDAAQVCELKCSLQYVLGASVKAGEIPRRSSWLASQRSQTSPRCPRCQTDLRRSRIAGRTGYWCPVCQASP